LSLQSHPPSARKTGLPARTTTKAFLAKAHGRLPGGSAPFCAAAQLYPRCRLQARIDVLLRDFLADDVPLADRPLSACSLALVLLLTLALAFDFVIISRCSVALDLYLGLRHDGHCNQLPSRARRCSDAAGESVSSAVTLADAPCSGALHRDSSKSAAVVRVAPWRHSAHAITYPKARTRLPGNHPGNQTPAAASSRAAAAYAGGDGQLLGGAAQHAARRHRRRRLRGERGGQRRGHDLGVGLQRGAREAEVGRAPTGTSSRRLPKSACHGS
jgi:hypothetical protein